jgi:hypothetical protein
MYIESIKTLVILQISSDITSFNGLSEFLVWSNLQPYEYSETAFVSAKSLGLGSNEKSPY